MSACNKSDCGCGNTNPTDLLSPSRRNFLGGAAAVATVTLAPGITITAFGGSAKASTHHARWGLLVDVNKCKKDCNACVTACSTEHGWEANTDNPLTDAQWIRKVTLKDKKTGLEQSLPVMCQHCAEPPCVDVCPTAASFRRDDGIVLVDKHLCIGCRYCVMACPYQARSFIHEPLIDQKEYSPRGKGTVEGCNLCVHRVDKGGTPACVEACSATGNGAMMFGNLNDPNSEISKRIAEYPSTQIRADLGLDPGVRYANL